MPKSECIYTVKDIYIYIYIYIYREREVNTGPGWAYGDGPQSSVSCENLRFSAVSCAQKIRCFPGEEVTSRRSFLAWQGLQFLVANVLL